MASAVIIQKKKKRAQLILIPLVEIPSVNISIKRENVGKFKNHQEWAQYPLHTQNLRFL